MEYLHPIKFIVVLFVFVMASMTLSQAEPFKRVCYLGPLTVSQLNVSVCTHYMYHGRLEYESENNTFQWKSTSDINFMANLTKIKHKFNFQVFAGLGNFVEVGSSKENMTNVAEALVKFLRKYQMDGVDFDWEFPSGSWKEPFAKFMAIIRNKFDSAGQPKLSLSLAVATDFFLIHSSYNVTSLASSLDFISIMGYDFTNPATFHLTDFHSSLYAPRFERPIIYLNTRNLNWTAYHYVELGMPKSKIVLGLPAYAHGWRLKSSLDHGLFAPSTGRASPSVLGTSGICQFYKMNGTHRVWDNYAQSPYAYNNLNWYSFDDFQSVDAKVKYCKDNNFSGLMVFSLASDTDSDNQCETGTKYPIHSRITDLLNAL